MGQIKAPALQLALKMKKNGDGYIFLHHCELGPVVIANPEGVKQSRFLRLLRSLSFARNDKVIPSGFTLIELILVVTVIITLALIAIPNYSKSKNRAIEKEAISNVRLMAAAERIYKMESAANAYVACADAAACNTALKLNLNTTNWGYKVEVAAGGVATITATGSAISGCSYTLTSADFDASPAPSACP